MEITAKHLAELLNGEVEGDPEVLVNSLTKIEEGQPQSLSFLANPLYTEHVYTTAASVVIVGNDFVPEKALPTELTLVRVEDPRLSFTKVLEAYAQYKSQRSGKEEPHYVHESASVGDDVYLGAFSYIGKNATIGNQVKIHPHVHIGEGASVGDGTILHPGVRIGDDCQVGARCTLQPGVIVGGDGFGFAPNRENEYHKVPHLGNVILEDHVEIGANTTIDRGTLGSTIVRKGVKLDNLIQVAHNVEIGENTVIAAQTGIAGSTTIGRDCMIGGQVGIVGHLRIADGVKIAAQSGIGHSIEEKGSIVQGSPAFSIGDYKRSYVLFRNLPDLKKRIEKLEQGPAGEPGNG